MKPIFVAIAVLMWINCGSSETFSTDIGPENTELQEPESSQQDSTSNEEDELRDELKEFYRNELLAQYQAQANSLASYYILAQQYFFNGQYEVALTYINIAQRIRETADVLALKGSIYLGLGQVDNFIANWRAAFEMDPEVLLPPSPYIVEQLQENGLIDDNLEPIL